MTRYASGTEVSTERSRNEIERTLARYGADRFSYAYENTRAGVMFEAHGRRVRFVLPLPDKEAKEFRLDRYYRERPTDKQHEKWEQACRQRWRALALVIKAKLEAVAAGITSFEDEFLAHTVLPDGSTVSEFMQPQIDIAYQTGELPRALIALPASSPA